MPSPSQYVTAEDICRHFNGGRYFERWQTGELSTGELIDVCESPSNFPAGTRSQMVSYVDQRGMTVAWVHQDGDSLGNPALGRQPDPKFLFHKGVRYRYSPLAPFPPLGGGPSRRR